MTRVWTLLRKGSESTKLGKRKPAEGFGFYFLELCLRVHPSRYYYSLARFTTNLFHIFAID